MTQGKTSHRNTGEGVESHEPADVRAGKAKRPRGKAVKGGLGSTLASRNTEAIAADLTPEATQKPPRQTKAALLRARLSDAGGVSLATLIEATGWQAHTLRAAMSGLRKEGLTLTRRREGEDTIYAIEHRGTGAADTLCAKKDTPTVAPVAPAAKVAASHSSPDATTAADATGTDA